MSFKLTVAYIGFGVSVKRYHLPYVAETLESVAEFSDCAAKRFYSAEVFG